VRGSIRNIEAYAEAALRRRTERFDECFPRGITLGDLDSFCEIDGRFLVIEWKVSGQIVPTGQLRAFRELAKVPLFTVVVLWTSKEGAIEFGQQVHPSGAFAPEPCTEEEAKQFVRQWVSARKPEP
jgi:hypothetical protein